MPGTFNDGFVKGYNAGAALVKKAFVTFDGSDETGQTVVQAGLNDDTPPLGVSKFSVSTAEIAQGKGASVVIDGRAIVTVGSDGALAVGTSVTSDADGLAQAAGDGDWLVGIVDQPGDVGNDCVVLLSDPGNRFYAG